MPPRARKSQPKSLQYRPKSAQSLPEEPMSPKSTQCHPKATQCPRNLRSLLQVEATDPSGVGCGRGLSQDVPIYEKSTLHRCKVLFGAENGARTRDLNLGKVALYQLSYFRNITPHLAVGITKVRSFF